MLAGVYDSNDESNLKTDCFFILLIYGRTEEI